MKYNSAMEVSFSIDHNFDDPEQLFEKENIYLVLEGLEKRLLDLKENLEEAAGAFNVWDTFSYDTNSQ